MDDFERELAEFAENPFRPEPLPSFILDALAKSDKPIDQLRDKRPPLAEPDTEEIKALAQQYIESLPTTEKGNRDNTAYKVACQIKNYGVSEAGAHSYLMEWNYTKALPSLSEEHIVEKIHSAYKTSRRPQGIDSPEHRRKVAQDEFTDASAMVGEDDQPKPTSKRTFLRREGLEAGRKAVKWLIDGIVQEGVTELDFGDTSIGKSAVKLDQAAHIAAGLSYHGRKTKQGLVVYVAAEGGRGMVRRLWAWRARYAPDKVLHEIPIALVPFSFNLLETKEVKALIDVVVEAENHFKQPVRLIVLDTLARTVLGDENDAGDMSRYTGAMDRLKGRFPGTNVTAIHHTGLTNKNRARGSYSLKCNIDVEVKVDKGVIYADKDRDADPERGKIYFGLTKQFVGYDDDGDPIEAVVAIPQAALDIPDAVATTGLDPKIVGFLEDIKKTMVSVGKDCVGPSDMVAPWKIQKSGARKRLAKLVELGILINEEGEYSFLHEATNAQD